MQSFQAVDGQCVRIEHDGIGHLALVDCDDAEMPCPDDRASWIDAVLAAIRIGFEATDSFEELLDHRCYVTADRKCLHPTSLEVSASLSVENPQSLPEVEARAEACNGLVSRITESIGSGSTGGRRRWEPDFAKRLEELIEVLQLDQSTNAADRRLWFLELYHRAEKFGKTCKWQLGNDQKAVTAHRNQVAHPGVKKIDEKQVKTLQKAIFGKIDSRL